MNIWNAIIRILSGGRINFLYRTHHTAAKVQKQTFLYLMKQGVKTEWGRTHGYTSTLSYQAFAVQTPISSYENLFSYIEAMLMGKSSVLWPGTITLFSKSSGTTNDRSKYIPISKETIRCCHFRGGKDMALFYIKNKPKATMLLGKTIGVGGSFDTAHGYNKNFIIGDLSAILMREMPLWAKHKRTPRLAIATLPTWEEKLTQLAIEAIKEDVRGIAGVPSWSQLLIKKVLALSGKKSIYEVWPHFEVFFHGGVSLDPYRQSFRELLGDNFHYEEVYNASEGFFAIQDNPHKNKELLLMLDYGIFYEFITMDSYHSEHKKVCTIEDVVVGVPYALIISTTSGLWRYSIGDVVVFVSIDPYRIQIVGRTTASINIFGEELMVGNTDQAIAEVSLRYGVRVSEYTVAPQLNASRDSGFHEWVIEFDEKPRDIASFTDALDTKLRELNSDYDAKRKSDMLLKQLTLRSVPKGTFYSFMKARNRLGGQAKVPRLSEDRKYITALLDIVEDAGAPLGQ